MKVFKYPVDLIQHFNIQIPHAAKLLSFQVQDNVPMIWALVDENQPLEERKFRVAGTGHPIDDSVKAYVGTIQMANGLVWHLFEIN